ncbi:MAG: hypothetical protein K2J82_09110, partial [Muribaculaceae bacterium]|nr:hypothetical protein [Muribaculaceae bacterium]
MFFASNIGAMTCVDLVILHKYRSTGDLVEFDEDESPTGHIIGKSIEDICSELNSNNYNKFVSSNSSEGVTEISLSYYLSTDNSYFSQKTKFDAYRVAANAFIDTIHKQYSMAIFNNKVELDIEIEIDFPLKLNPIQFQFITLLFKNKPTNYLAGRC